MNKLSKLTFITGNAVKAEAIKKYLDFPVEHQKLDIPEIQSLDLKEVVTFKAKEAYKYIKSPVLVEDTSLSFLALGRLPGTFIKWFEEMGNEKLCRLLDPYPDRSAIYEIALGLYDGQDMVLFTESAYGKIAKEPKGDGFGWNSIFMYNGSEKTLAELNSEEKESLSTRRRVIKKVEAYLKENTNFYLNPHE